MPCLHIAALAWVTLLSSGTDLGDLHHLIWTSLRLGAMPRRLPSLGLRRRREGRAGEGLGLPILSGSPQSGSLSGRFLAETGNVSKEDRPVDDTVRVDPLDHLKKYRGGYNITNPHYLGSTVFTGIYGFALAALWLLCGLGYGVMRLVMIICCKSRKKHKKREDSHMQCLLLALVFTLLAIAACGLVLGGDAKFHSRARMIIEVIIGRVGAVSSTIYKTTGAMKNVSSSLSEVGTLTEATAFLNSTSLKLDAQAADIEKQAYGTRQLIENGLKLVFAGDTCTALEGFQKDPYNNSLSHLLPCEKLLSAKPVLNNVSIGVHELVNKVNTDISNRFGDILQLCNPFASAPTYEYQPWNCPATSIRIGDIPRVLRLIACPDSESTTCVGGIMIPGQQFKMVEAYSSSVQKLLDAYPGVESLIKCQPIMDTFSEILQKHCTPLKRHLRLIWAALVFLSMVLMALVTVWTVGVHYEQDDNSLIIPNDGDMLECGVIKPPDGEFK
ncbi:hypothetical protein Sango_0633100 [Sesamum angolense]|uniref:Uncharacterized protein n=1 Tax=Sesamum angolense TaxID=2727404 RepID=A0AAE2C255_9LAMI|nr:hypothetical protein Sango_0633100 [Sesamum angolense]